MWAVGWQHIHDNVVVARPRVAVRLARKCARVAFEVEFSIQNDKRHCPQVVVDPLH